MNNPPINGALVNVQTGKSTNPFSQWLTQAQAILFDQQNSGPTAQRPSTGLYPGKQYFDISLGANGKPIFVNKTSTGWVLADGTAA